MKDEDYVYDTIYVHRPAPVLLSFVSHFVIVFARIYSYF